MCVHVCTYKYVCIKMHAVFLVQTYKKAEIASAEVNLM